MKPVRILVVALLGYAAALAPTISQAHSVDVFLPGINVRLPAPPLPILVPPGVTVREVGFDRYDRDVEYRRMPPPRYYREDWRARDEWRAREAWHEERANWRHERDYHDDHFDHHDHERGDWRR